MKSLRTISKLLINILCLRYQLVKITGPSRLSAVAVLEWSPDSRPYSKASSKRPGPNADPDSEAAAATWLLFIMPCCCCRRWEVLQLLFSPLFFFLWSWLLLVGSVRLVFFFFLIFSCVEEVWNRFQSPLDRSLQLDGRLASSAGRDLSAKDTNNSSNLNNFSKGRLLYLCICLYSMKFAQRPKTHKKM